MPSDELLNPKEAAALLPETSTQTLMRWARAGTIESVRLPSGRRYFMRSTIERLLTPSTAAPARDDTVLPGQLVLLEEAVGQ